MEKYAKNPRNEKGKKRFIIILVVIAVLLTAAVAAAVYVVTSYHIVEGKLYAKDTAVLNLLEEEINPGHYDKIHEKMPECRIQWNIPFQGGTLANDATEITVTALTEADVAMLDYAEHLTTVHAAGCTDYEALDLLRQNRPEVEVIYDVSFSGGSVSWDAEALELKDVAEADIQLLKHLPNLKTVSLAGGDHDSAVVEALRNSVRNAGQIGRAHV